MASNRPDPGDFLQQAQRMLRELFSDQPGDDQPWAEATRSAREPSAEEQRENLTFALAPRTSALGCPGRDLPHDVRLDSESHSVSVCPGGSGLTNVPTTNRNAEAP